MELDVSYTFTINLNFKSGRQGLRSKPFDKHCSTVHSILNEVKTANLARTWLWALARSSVQFPHLQIRDWLADCAELQGRPRVL